MQTIKNLPIQLITIASSSSFDGYEIHFRVNNQDFHFFIGNKNRPFPLSVKHIFKEKEVCTICNKNIAPFPVGQQLCMEFQKELPSLLTYFQEEYPQAF